MKISLSWLSDYVDVQEFFKTPDELSRLLTGAGLEVESVQDGAKQFQHVVVGQVVELGQHPKADKLTLCQVDAGEGKPRQIICGAKNHKQGDKVVVALPGAVLPGDFAIKISKIRDVESQGMLCSESELGFKDESEGILLLPKDAKVGQPFAEYYGLADVVFEINVTPNRADCLSHIGLAREISCLLDRPLRMPEGAQLKSFAGQASTAQSGAAGQTKNISTPKVSTRKTAESIKVQLKQADMCPRYAGRSVFGVTVGPSPEWLKLRLKSVGLNSINNIVDVTNFVMMEFGQPLHAFDAKEIRGAQITIDKAKAGEKFTTFDGTELTLKGEELTIRDQERAVALAGVIGGKNSGVTEATKEIFIEAAHFNPKSVRRAARANGLDTDSSHRFSRGTDPEAVLLAMNRAAALIQALAGGEIAPDHHDVYPTPVARKPITVRKKTLEDRLGYAVDMNEFTRWMKRLHCKLPAGAATTNEIQVEAPAFRFDLDQEMDFVEEFARLHGYDKIPETFPKLEQWPTDSALNFNNENRVAELFTHEGYFEARNYNFVSGKWQASLFNHEHLTALGLNVGGPAVDIRNPLSEETGQMRQSLLPGLLTNMLHNYHRGQLDGRLFEAGYVFAKQGDGYKESHRVAIISWGQNQSLWQKETHPVIYEVKSAVEHVIQKLGGSVLFKEMPKASAPFIHPGQAALLFYEGRVIGFIGALHPAYRDEHKLRHEVAFAEIDIEALMRGQPRKPKLAKISKFSAVERDLALVMPAALAAGDVLREIQKAGVPLMQSVEIFDVYQGQGVAEGMKSVAFRMHFQDPEKTLAEEQLNQAVAAICAALDKKFQIKPR